MEPLIIITIFIAFFATYLTLPFWIKGAYLNGLVGKDMHKKDKRKIAEGGGLIVLGGFTLGVLSYIAINTFFIKSSYILVEIFALLTMIFIISLVGIIDDLLGWKKGLSKRLRFAATFLAAVPLIVINAGHSTMSLPFLGSINFGLLYPLLIIPIGVMGATTAFNTLAGYNGLESSQGIILLSALSFATYLSGNRWLSVVSLIMVFSLLAFYIFNKVPAKIFPGDILTYSVGALIAGIAILGNIEKFALIIFTPYIIEVILKSRGKLKKESFAKLNKNGGLEMPYKKIYGLEHLAILILKKFDSKKEVSEKNVVYLINGFQILVVILAFLFTF